jgi:hypothetical protein
MMQTPKDPWKIARTGFCAVLLLLSSISHGAEQKTFREEAQFEISVAGREIGQEKFSIQGTGDSVRSHSTMSFQNPANSRQNVKIETELMMDDRFVPRSYQLQTDVAGQKGIMNGTFDSGQASFEIRTAAGRPSKTGLLVGEHYIVLDTNVFHHFVFIARLFDFNSKEKSQSLEVVIPQELQNGLLKISEIAIEKVAIRGKRRELHHLKADSGQVQIDLWVDDQHILYKIAMPVKGIEVVRN